MATSVTIVSIAGPYTQLENAAGSAVQTSTTRWIATAQLPDGRRVTAGWIAPTYVTADMKAAVAAVVNGLLTSQNPDTGTTQLV